MSQKYSRNSLKFGLTLISSLFIHIIYAQYNFSAIDEIAGNKKEQAVGNTSIAIWKDGKIIYQKDTGSMRSGKMEVQQPIGEASKWLTVALVMTFVDEGTLSLDDQVSKYIPVFSSYSKGYITIRQCLANTTGIEALPGKSLRLLQKKKFESLEKEVDYYAAHNDIVNNPGKDFVYGDVGFVIAGRILEVISKRKTFDRLIMEKIIRPAGMKKTSFMVETGAPDPATGAISTAEDYVKFLGMLLNKGQANGKRILSEAAIAEMRKMQIKEEMIRFIPKIMEGASYGLGIFLEDNGNVISCPSFAGAYPFIDICRNYACVIITPPLKEYIKREMYLLIKEVIDRQIGTGCK